ncbi:MAG: alpha/beta fold hydrolase [Bacteriovoracia bacterium]
MKQLLISFLLISTSLWAIPEEGFEEQWNQEVLPYFHRLQEGEIINKQGLTLKYFHSSDIHPENHTLVIVPGRTEPAMKYAELIFDLRHSRLNIFIMDHQGQGLSQRLLKDTHKGHIHRFSDYVQDFEQFMNEVVMKSSANKLYLIAHSMGGAVTTSYLSRNPDVFTKAALMAPMLEINTEPYSEIVARYYAKILVTIGKGDEYAPGKGPYLPEEDKFETNDVTQSEARFNAAKSLFLNAPSLIVGGPSARWVHESLKFTKNIHKLKMKTPVILFQSGKDEVVKPSRQNSFCRKSFCRMIRVPEAKHEMLMETDSIRNSVLKQIESFFSIDLFPEDRKSIKGY